MATQRFQKTATMTQREIDRLNGELYVFVMEQMQQALSKVHIHTRTSTDIHLHSYAPPSAFLG